MSRNSIIKLSDVAVGSSKEFTVPDNVFYELLYAHASLVTTATGTARVLRAGVKDSGDTVNFDVHAGATVAASTSTPQHHELMQGIYRETSFSDNAIQVPIPQQFFIPPGYKLFFEDENAQDVSGDTLAVYAFVRKHPQ